MSSLANLGHCTNDSSRTYLKKNDRKGKKVWAVKRQQ